MQKTIIKNLFICLLINGVVIADQGVGESASGFLTSLPPDAPVLYSPANEATSLPDTITMIWHHQVHSSSYSLQISLRRDFASLIIDQTELADTLFLASVLENDTTYHWRVSASNVAGEGIYSEIWSFTTSSTSDVDGKINFIPQSYALLPAYPNPFNPTTTITYYLPEEAEVSLVIYNCIGQFVRELVSSHHQAGVYLVTWDGRNNHGVSVTSGLYICHFKAGSYMFTQKILLMR